MITPPRGYHSAAPLKQHRKDLRPKHRFSLRGYHSAAPLKQHMNDLRPKLRFALRGYHSAAPLKHGWPTSIRRRTDTSPWISFRGPVEADLATGNNAITVALRGYHSAAPLKP